MKTGELIRKYRKLKGMTQLQLGEAAGMSEPAIRNYELGNRDPGEKQLKAIAKALDINAEALVGYEIENARDVLGVLFQMEDEFGLTPQEDGTLAIDLHNKNAKKTVMAIKAWQHALEKVESGEMSREEYELYRARIKS